MQQFIFQALAVAHGKGLTLGGIKHRFNLDSRDVTYDEIKEALGAEPLRGVVYVEKRYDPEIKDNRTYYNVDTR